MERWSTYVWLPAAFVVEVAAWEIGSRMDLALVDPSWEELGRTIGVERVTWMLGGVVVLLFAAFMVLARHRHTVHVSLVQLVGVLALACYWIGASVGAAGAVVLGSSLAAWVLGHRVVPRERSRRR